VHIVGNWAKYTTNHTTNMISSLDCSTVHMFSSYFQFKYGLDIALTRQQSHKDAQGKLCGENGHSKDSVKHSSDKQYNVLRKR